MNAICYFNFNFNFSLITLNILSPEKLVLNRLCSVPVFSDASNFEMYKLFRANNLNI